ncbi:MAG: hypothetical protein H7840_13085 [Alphaproteobacteria bacterium]
MSTLRKVFAPLLSVALSIVVLADEGALDVTTGVVTSSPFILARPAAPTQFPVVGTVHGEAGYWANMMARPSYTPNTFNRSNLSGTASALAYSLDRSHAFSRNLYRRDYDNDKKITINLY